MKKRLKCSKKTNVLKKKQRREQKFSKTKKKYYGTLSYNQNSKNSSMDILKELYNKKVDGITTSDLNKIQKGFDKLKEKNEELDQIVRTLRNNNFVKISTSSTHYTRDVIIGLKTQKELADAILAPYKNQEDRYVQEISRLKIQLEVRNDQRKTLDKIGNKLDDILSSSFPPAELRAGYFSNNQDHLDTIKKEVKNIRNLIYTANV